MYIKIVVYNVLHIYNTSEINVSMQGMWLHPKPKVSREHVNALNLQLEDKKLLIWKLTKINP